jgi:hypothetical protein
MRTRVPVRRHRALAATGALVSGGLYAPINAFFEGGYVQANCFIGCAIPAGNWVSWQLVIDGAGYGSGAADYPSGTNMMLVFFETPLLSRGFHKLGLMCMGFSANGTINNGSLDVYEIG